MQLLLIAQEARLRLPAIAMSGQVVATVRDNRVVLVTGETGCGKTTQVPRFIMEDCMTRYLLVHLVLLQRLFAFDD
jgi:HrpA-like RNA helicase